MNNGLPGGHNDAACAPTARATLDTPLRMTTPSRARTITTLGTAQTLAWASSYYLPAVLAAPMARDLGVATPTVFAAFSLASGLLSRASAIPPSIARNGKNSTT